MSDEAPGAPAAEGPSWVWWSTPATVAAGVPSFWAIVETFLAVAAVWGLAWWRGSWWPLAVGALLPLFVLFRSKESTEAGLRWFARFENERNAKDPEKWGRKEWAWLSVSFLVSVLASFAVTWWLAQTYLVGLTGWQAFVGGIIIGWVGVAVAVAVAGAVAAAAAAAVVGALAGAVAVVVVGVGVVAGLGAAAGAVAGLGAAAVAEEKIANPRAKAAAAAVASIIWLPVAVGFGAAIYLVSLVIRSLSLLRHPIAGSKAMPGNYGRLVWCASLNHPPELLPGLNERESAFKVDEYLRRARSATSWVDRMEFSIAIPIWFLPAWLYRWSVKSTFWAWWPLAFVGARPRYAEDPQYFYEEVNQDALRRVTRWLALLSVVGFVGFSAGLYFDRTGWQVPADIPVAALPWLILATVEHAPGEWIAFAGAAIALAVKLWIDRAYRLWTSAHRRNDAGAIARAERHFPRIERLWRLGFLSAMVSGALTVFALLLYANSRQCLVPDPPARVMAVAKWLYGARTPPPPRCGA